MAANPITTIVCFVLLSMAVNLAVLNVVYDMDPGNQHLSMDIDAQSSTGSAVLDGIMNGMLLLIAMAIICFTLVACMLYKLQWIVVFFIKTSFVLLVYTLPAIIISDFCDKFYGDKEKLRALMSATTIALYSLLVYSAYNTDRLPNITKRIITVLNCSFISVYYLRIMSRHTIWFLLMAVILWDLFAVKSKFGPLKLARQNATDYDASILPYILFTAYGDNTDEDDSLMISSSNEDYYDGNTRPFTGEEDLTTISTDDSTTTSFTVTVNLKERKNAYDVLHDPNLTSLGLGDFIIYNILVGRVAMSGAGLTVLLTIIGIIVGLIVAFQLSSEEEERDSAYYPALPISLILGMTFYGTYLAFSCDFSDVDMLEGSI